ncbi:hypothetical protein VTP01DRAFT_3119 [Rhizomucor pusillus]|uniref:uncharacterized protein n=1 Tax=Rhizomucor pusillus TaxID=4840 RepID=UPI0037440996
MDVYALTRKKRPTHLTLGKPTRSFSLDASPSPTISAEHSNTAKRQSLNTASTSFEAVTGPPTRDHWKPDADASRCGHFGCQTTFGFFERRHHCRRCGDIFCSAHCSNYLRLDQSSQFHPQGTLSRGCDSCAAKYRRWQEDLKQAGKRQDTREEQQQEEAKQDVKGSESMSYLRRRAGIMTPQPQAMEGVTELGRDDIVQPDTSQRKGIAIKTRPEVEFNPIPSVPADWQWSTF